MARTEPMDPWRWGLAIAAVANLANAAWMLVEPADWYARLPAGVPDTGPLNVHFVRDIGSAFAMMGVALGWAAFRPALRAPFLALTALFYVLHALVHVTDTLAGRLPPSHWLVDTPGVYAPAVVMIVLAVLATRGAERT
ncbi:MAG: hypothetical protein KIT14_04490 [bacterium]|nr:hypothetical protein [bacterium]